MNFIGITVYNFKNSFNDNSDIVFIYIDILFLSYPEYSKNKCNKNTKEFNADYFFIKNHLIVIFKNYFTTVSFID